MEQNTREWLITVFISIFLLLLPSSFYIEYIERFFESQMYRIFFIGFMCCLPVLAVIVLFIEEGKISHRFIVFCILIGFFFKMISITYDYKEFQKQNQKIETTEIEKNYEARIESYKKYIEEQEKIIENLLEEI